MLLAARLMAAPTAILWCHDPTAQDGRMLAGHGVPAAWEACDFTPVDALIGSDDLLLVPNATRHEALLRSRLAQGEDGARLLVALRLHDTAGTSIGLLCVCDRVARQPSAEQMESLRLIGRQIEARFGVDDQHAAEQALKAEQQLNRSIFDSSPIGIAIYDRNGDCVSANEAMARHVGCEVSQILEQNIHRIRSWQETGVYAIALRALTGGGRSSGVIGGVSSFGKPIWLSVEFTVLDTPSLGHLMLMTQDLSEFKHAEDARREVQERFEMLFVHSMDGILLGRPDGTITAANPALCRLLGVSEAELLARGRAGVLDQSDERLVQMTQERRLTGRTRGEVRLLRPDGSHIEVECTSVLYPDSQGRMLSSSVIRDISQRRNLERRLAESLDMLQRLSQRVPGVLYQYRLFPDGRSCFPFASEGLRSIYEVSPEEVREDASPVFERLHPDDYEDIVASIQTSARTLQPWHLEYRVVLPKQGVRWRQGDAKPEQLPDGSILWHGFIMDITQRRREAEKTHWLAYFDSLTALPNRRLFFDRINQSLLMARRSGMMGGLIFIDLDHFKRINDARGHVIGDALLQQVAQRLSNALHSQNTVARLGGDEFVLLINELGRDADAAARAIMAVAHTVRATLDEPYTIEGRPYTSSGSFGITIFPKGEETVDDLLREADTAMYRAKSAGRNRIAFFETTMQAEVEETLALEHDLKDAITLGQLSLHAQGQYDSDGHLAGAELLLRWQHPTRGAIPPTQFIPLAENSGQIVRIGEWVIEQAAAALARIDQAGAALSLSINVSPIQFRNENFVERVRAILAAAGAPPSRLVLEVTEGLLIDDRALVAARMHELVELGVRFSIDDFGTGFCNFQYLRDLPLYEIKIDRGFVHGIPHDSKATAIVTAILAVAEPLQLRVVAEGVETAEQAEFLLQSGCDSLQGYLFARPTPFDPWLDREVGSAPGG